MNIPDSDVWTVLRGMNHWWDARTDLGVPTWRRAAYREIRQWIINPPTARALLLSGARRVGKTTLLRQCIQELLASGVPPRQILYVTFDNPILKLLGLDNLLKYWDALQPKTSGDSPSLEYLFLDEIQYTADWQVWLKHQVDFQPLRRIAVTGSAIPLTTERQESGVGRWHTLVLPTLSFYEYLQLRTAKYSEPPRISSLKNLFNWDPAEFARVAALSADLIPHFHDYLLRGGFPETTKIENLNLAQKLLREDIVDKVLKRDMTALFGVRKIVELEKLFIYLCLHDGGILDKSMLSRELDIKLPLINNFLALFESTHLIYQLKPYAFGKAVLRGKNKVYLADPAIAGSVLSKGESLLADPTRLGAAVEAAFFKHVYKRFYSQSISFCYWRHPRGELEVDVIANLADEHIPFEVKYSESPVVAKQLKGLRLFCQERELTRGYAITKLSSDFGPLQFPDSSTVIMKIPAPLACYWLSESESRDE